MAKASDRKPAKATVDADALAIKAIFLDERSDDSIMLFVPSHDRKQKRLSDQDQWAYAGLRLFADLYRGATAFPNLKGIWRCDDGTDVLDEPILLQSLVRREDAVNEEKLELLADFARRLCRDTNQECVAVFCNDTMHYVYAKAH